MKSNNYFQDWATRFEPKSFGIFNFEKGKMIYIGNDIWVGRYKNNVCMIWKKVLGKIIATVI